MDIIADVILEIIGVLLIAVVGWVSTKIKARLDTDEKKKVAETVVKAVEQIYKDLDGEEKFETAVKNITELLSSKGIKISELEIKMLIEAAVQEINSTKLPFEELMGIEDTEDETTLEDM